MTAFIMSGLHMKLKKRCFIAKLLKRIGFFDYFSRTQWNTQLFKNLFRHVMLPGKKLICWYLTRLKGRDRNIMAPQSSKNWLGSESVQYDKVYTTVFADIWVEMPTKNKIKIIRAVSIGNYSHYTPECNRNLSAKNWKFCFCRHISSLFCFFVQWHKIVGELFHAKTILMEGQ